MSYEINVISRHQTIIVEPTSKSVSVVNEHGPPGPQGATGPAGATGPQGPAATGAPEWWVGSGVAGPINVGTPGLISVTQQDGTSGITIVGTNKVTVSADGLYFCTYNVTAQANPNPGWITGYLRHYRGTTLIQERTFVWGTSGTSGFGEGAIESYFQMTAGDEIRFYANAMVATNLDNRTWFSVSKQVVGAIGPTGLTGATGPPHPAGLAQDAGFERHSTAQPQVALTTGVTISFNVLDRESASNPFVDYLGAGVAFILASGNAGVYHITGYVMSQGSPVPSAGSFVAIRVNSLVVARQFIPTQAFGSAEVSTDIWLNDNDVVSLFVYPGATAWNIQAATSSALDALSPYLRIWKHVQGPKGDKGDPGGTGVPTSDAWTTPSLLNGWATFGSPYETPGYYKDPLGIVHLKGLYNQTGNRLQTMFLLPVGYRPLNTSLFPVVSVDAFGQVRIGGPVGTGPSDGQVLPTAPIPASSGWVSLDGITFRAR